MKQSSGVIERKAINPSGVLGSLYDASRDRLVEHAKMSCREEWLSPSQCERCKLKYHAFDENFNVLQFIGIQDHFRLSLLLNMTKRSGIAEVLTYSHRIDRYTRFLYCSWVFGKLQFHEKEIRFPQKEKVWNPFNNATHMITGITFGIDVLFVLQLSPENVVVNAIDRLFEDIQTAFQKENKSGLRLMNNRHDLLEKILSTKVYSNIPSLTGFAKITDVFSQVDAVEIDFNCRSPLSYTLTLITSLHSPGEKTAHKFAHPLHFRKAENLKLLPTIINKKIEQYFLQSRNAMQYTDASLNKNIPRLSWEHLPKQLKKAHTQWDALKKTYMNNMHQISTLVIDVRNGKRNSPEAVLEKCDDAQKSIENEIKELIRNTNYLEEKGRVIMDLREHRFEYWDATDFGIGENHDIKGIERKMMSNDPHNRILCSNDILNEKNPTRLENLCRALFENYKKNTNLRLIYADFSYSSFQLRDMMVFPSEKSDYIKEYSEKKNLTQISAPKPDSILPKSRESTDEFINILLLGETGVGKSTFINAFANYLTFSSLEQAESNEPVVIIPVSFMMTSGDDFQETIIKFGEIDSVNNEQFNNLGQSVTQHCKSYVFDLKNSGTKKVRIIDTPGFGNTRGLDQDEKNMEHTLQYITNLTHLNAICFLLKPNATRLSVFSQTCFTQLFSLLGSTARENIIFCFTNARSTFYTPGNTAPLLKNILASSSLNDITFEKKNTFCFDSESFRYLVARRNGIQFSDEEKHEYATSWSTSVKESNRMIDFIKKELTVYQLKSGWQSVKHAKLEISYMIRPILEAIRNTLRNIILCERNPSNQIIEMTSKPLSSMTTRCRSCRWNLQQVGKFWIVPIFPHDIQNGCLLCACALDQHVPIDYILEYKCSNNTSNYKQNEMNDRLNKLVYTSARLSHFLMHDVCLKKDDPFLNEWLEMISEEEYICKNEKSNDYNSKLTKRLLELCNQYKEEMNQLKSSDENINLTAIYELIKSIGEYSIVKEQVMAVKKTRQIMLKEYEYGMQSIV